MDQWLKEIEKYKEDSNKYYQATCKVNLRKPKKSLKIYDDNFNLKKKSHTKKRSSHHHIREDRKTMKMTQLKNR